MSAINLVDGERTTGQDVRSNNVTAVLAVANVVKSSLGPVGLDKMLVDEIGDVTITNDGATILQRLDVEHPAAKVLVELANLQDQEVGDGTTSVVIIAATLLKHANELVKQNIHPTTIMSGLRMALKESVKYIKSDLMCLADQLPEGTLLAAAKTSMSSKIIGLDSPFFSKLAVDAVRSVKTVSKNDGKTRYPVSAIHILKCHGKSSTESHMVEGFALAAARAAQGMPTLVRNAKIALLDFDLRRHKVGLGVEVIVKDAAEAEGIRKREMDITKDRINKILAAGANVILTTKGIDDLCLKYFVEAGALAVRRCKKEDLKRIAKATGGELVVTLADMEGNESYDPASLGTADEAAEERVGDNDMIYIRGGAHGAATTIVLRGANEFHLDEMDRSLHDSLMVIKRVLESNAVVAGGGAVEAALAVRLEEYAMTIDSREQLAILEFAQALLVIPKTLALNAALDATEIVSKLTAAHALSQDPSCPPDKEHLKFAGLDLYEGTVKDNLSFGVLEPAISKIKSLRFATEAAITILRIDDMIKLAKKEEGDPRGGR